MANKTSDAASVVTGKGKIVGGVLAVLAVLVVVAIVVINSGLFTATDIQIQGSEHVTKHDAIQLIDLPEGTSLFNVDPDQITEDLKQNPWVSGVDVQRQFPHTLIITPMERKVIAIAYIIMVTYLKDHGVQFYYDTKVVDVQFSLEPGKKQAAGITVDHKGAVETIDLTEDDLLFITNGGCVESCTVGAQNKATGFDPTIKPGNGWDLWKRIAALDDSFGHPEKFCRQPELTNWESATITTLDEKIPQYIQKICKRDPFSGRTVTGGIVTVKDSKWLMSWTLNRQQQFRAQPKDQLCVWVYGLFSDKPGDYVKKPMRDCTGREICMEWLYHLGVPVEDIAELAEHSANTVPVMMPYIDAFFMPRAKGDRPDIVPKDAVNFAFLGQFAETERDTIFTTEYSMRTGMEAVYRLLNIDRGVPEVWGSTYDVRALVDASVKLRDGRKLTDMELPLMGRIALKEALKKIEGTDLEKFLRQYNAI